MRTFMMLLAASVASLTILVTPLSGAAQGQKPYAGLQDRTIKALSEQQVADLKAGRGMTLALAAELNGYPGPIHVLENAHALKLTPQQRDLTKSLYEAMKSEAIPLGERLVEQETMLDQLFAAKTITPAHLIAATQAIGLTQANLRQTHLKYHLSMMQVLSADQISLYRELRGYAPHGSSMHLHKHAPDAK